MKEFLKSNNNYLFIKLIKEIYQNNKNNDVYKNTKKGIKTIKTIKKKDFK